MALDQLIGPADHAVAPATLGDDAYRQVPGQGWQRRLKRPLDASVAVIALLLLAPVFLLVALGIKLTSRGPVFYRQVRLGQHGRPFPLIKFRTMVDEADA